MPRSWMAMPPSPTHYSRHQDFSAGEQHGAAAMRVVVGTRAGDVIIQILTDVRALTSAFHNPIGSHVFGNARERLARDGQIRGVNPAAIHGARDAVGEHRPRRESRLD